MSDRNEYTFENAKKCIEAYGKQRWQFLELWAAFDKDYHGLPCEKLKNPAIEFTKQAKSGKFNGMSDDQYNRALIKIEEASALFDDQPFVSADFLMQNIIIHGAFEGKDAEKSLTDYTDLLVDYQNILNEDAPAEVPLEEFEYPEFETPEKECQKTQEVHLSVFDKTQEIINTFTSFYTFNNTYPVEIIMRELKHDGYSEGESRKAVMDQRLDWVPMAEHYIAKFDDIYRKPSESLRMIENSGFSADTVDKVKKDDAFWARRASVHLFDKFACRPETTEQIALADLRSLGYSDKQASEALELCGLKFASEPETIVDDAVENFLADEDAENTANAKGDGTKPVFNAFPKSDTQTKVRHQSDY